MEVAGVRSTTVELLELKLVSDRFSTGAIRRLRPGGQSQWTHLQFHVPLFSPP